LKLTKQSPLIIKKNVKYSIMWLLTRNYYPVYNVYCVHFIYNLCNLCIYYFFVAILRFKGKAHLSLLVLREGSLWPFSFKGKICKKSFSFKGKVSELFIYYECTYLHILFLRERAKFWLIFYLYGRDCWPLLYFQKQE